MKVLRLKVRCILFLIRPTSVLMSVTVEGFMSVNVSSAASASDDLTVFVMRLSVCCRSVCSSRSVCLLSAASDAGVAETTKRTHITASVPVLMCGMPCHHICGRTWTTPSVLWRCWLGSRNGIRPVKNWVVGCWHGYLSEARCRFAYRPADATATHCLLLQ